MRLRAQPWAVAPFLLMQKIGLGAAFAASAGLLYVPFSEAISDSHGVCGMAGTALDQRPDF
jgi:hypothetical protein